MSVSKETIPVVAASKKFQKLAGGVASVATQLLKFSAQSEAGLLICLIDSRVWANENFFLKTDPIIGGNKPLKRFLDAKLTKKSDRRFNVLAFPAPKDFPHPDSAGKFLGELYLDPDYIKLQGADLKFMLIHGFLHLLGYDHKKKSDRMDMEKKEEELLKKISN